MVAMASQFCDADGHNCDNNKLFVTALYGERGVETGLLRGELGHDLPLAGFFAGGEVGPVGQRTFVHTYTCTAAILRATKSPTATSSPAS